MSRELIPQASEDLPPAGPAPVGAMDEFAAAAQGWGGSPLDPPAFAAGSAPGRLATDPYGQQDDACRGLSLPSPFEMGAGPYPGKAKACRAEGTEGAAALERFGEEDVPPAAPQDRFFKFMATTFYVPDAVEPSALGNMLLDLLLIELMASVTKVRRAKYAITADISAGSFAGLADSGECPQIGYEPCTLKIKMYAHGSESAIEFRRVAGDGVTFNDVYQRACRHIENQMAAQACVRK